MDNDWVDTLEQELSEPQPFGEVYCRQCVYLSNERRGSFLHAGPWEPVCVHPHATVLVKTWEGVRSYSVPPEQRNAHCDCPDFELRTLHNHFRVYPYRTCAAGLVVFGLLVFLGYCTLPAVMRLLW